MDGSLIKNNLEKINKKILFHCRESHRSVNEVKLIAVCKKQSIEKINQSLDLGIKYLAANYVQEWKQQKLQLKKAPKQWHFIGQLQTNKVKHVVGYVELIHSVDRLKLLKAIQLECIKKQVTQKILLEVKLVSERTKAGFAIAELDAVLGEIVNMPEVEVRGFMFMPPVGISEDESKNYFKQARALLLNYSQTYLQLKLTELSMGTSNDFGVAIEMGATMIRLGTTVYGLREY